MLIGGFRLSPRMRTQAITALLLTTLLLVTCVTGFERELQEESEKLSIGPNATTTAWGMSYDWSELPNDIHNMTGIDIDQIMRDLEDAALDGHINLDLSYGINGTTYYYVVQSQGESTEIDLAGSGGDVEVDVKETTITLRMAVESNMGIAFDWAEADVGFDIDMVSQANNAIIIDIEMREYYTTDDYHFAGMDVDVSGGLSYSTGMGLTADIYAGNDHITFENTSLSMSMDYTIADMTAEWRMEEPSTIYEDILSGDYDVIQWECDSTVDEADRDTWSQVSDYSTRNTGVLDDDDEPIESRNYGDYESETWQISDPGAEGMRLIWDEFDTEDGYDSLRIFDGNTDDYLDSMSGQIGSWASPWYSTDYLILEWSSDGSVSSDEGYYGFDLDYWESGNSAGKEEHLWLGDACGEIDYSWDVGFAYEITLANFPGTDLGFTSDQSSFTLSDSFTESGSDDIEDWGFSDTIYIVDHNYSVTNSDGSTSEAVRVEGGGPMLGGIATVLGGGMQLAIEDSDDLGDIEEDVDDIAEDWGDDYDESDGETSDIAEDYEDTDFADDMEEVSDEFEEVMGDIEDDMESKYTDARMYWLIGKESGNQIGPQMMALDQDEDEWVQIMGPEDPDTPAAAEDDNLELDYFEGEEAEEMQETVADLSEDELLEGDPISDSQSDSEGSDDSMMMYLMAGVITLIAVLLLGVMGMMLMRRNRGDRGMSEYNVNEAFNQSAYDMLASEMGGGMAPTSGPPTSASPPSGPPATMRGEFKDGFEWAEYPPNSGTWYYRDAVTKQWVRHG